jgi:hypothetical protein
MPIFGEKKIVVFRKKLFYDFLQKLAVVRAKSGNIFAKVFAKVIFKIGPRVSFLNGSTKKKRS